MISMLKDLKKFMFEDEGRQIPQIVDILLEILHRHKDKKFIQVEVG